MIERDSDTPPRRRRMVRRRELLRIGVVMSFAPILAGCASKFTRKSGDKRVVVEMQAANRYDPASVTIPVGATIVWTNASTNRHTATCDPADPDSASYSQLPEGATAWRSGDLNSGETWEHTFTTAGAYVYGCQYHGDRGMLGAITVSDDASA